MTHCPLKFLGLGWSKLRLNCCIRILCSLILLFQITQTLCELIVSFNSFLLLIIHMVRVAAKLRLICTPCALCSMTCTGIMSSPYMVTFYCRFILRQFGLMRFVHYFNWGTAIARIASLMGFLRSGFEFGSSLAVGLAVPVRTLPE